MNLTDHQALEALQARVSDATNAHLASLAKDASETGGAAAVIETRAGRITGYYIAGRILDYPLDLTQAYLSLRAARLTALMIEGDSPKAMALDEIETEALRLLTDQSEGRKAEASARAELWEASQVAPR
jgi:hypothetical protein